MAPAISVQDVVATTSHSRLSQDTKLFCVFVLAQKKPDMVANSQLPLEGYSMKRQHGHIPGIPVGQVFAGKGALCFANLHRNINAGIDYKCELDRRLKPASSFVQVMYCPIGLPIGSLC